MEVCHDRAAAADARDRQAVPRCPRLDGVDLDVVPGEVHCLLGQNGAGKSTLIKVLWPGCITPTRARSPGRATVRLSKPIAAMRLGISTIYQELDLVDGLTVTENIFLGHEMSTLGRSRRGRRQRARKPLLARLGHPEIPPRREVASSPAAGKQIVSMARALSHDVKLIVLDEPSAVLDQNEVQHLFGSSVTSPSMASPSSTSRTVWKRSARSATG